LTDLVDCAVLIATTVYELECLFVVV
jgi:hypothetical protein